MFQLDTGVYGGIKSKSDFDRMKAMRLEEAKQRQMQERMMGLQMQQAEKQLNTPETLATEQLLAKAIQMGGVQNLSPAEQAQLQAADIAQRTKQSVDPRGNVITNRSYFELMGMPASQVAQMSPNQVMGQRADSGMVSPTTQVVPNTGGFVDVASQPDLPMDGFQGLPLPPEPDLTGLSPYSAEDARQKYLEDVRKVQMENAKLQREAESNFSKVNQQASLISNTIDNLLDKNGKLKSGVGQSIGGFMGLQGLQASMMPLTQAQRDVQPFINQLQGQAFLQAFESLKGGGTITENEGLKAEQAISRLQQTQSEEAFAKALRDLREVANSAKNGAAKQAGQNTNQGKQDPLGIR